MWVWIRTSECAAATSPAMASCASDEVTAKRGVTRVACKRFRGLPGDSGSGSLGVRRACDLDYVLRLQRPGRRRRRSISTLPAISGWHVAKASAASNSASTEVLWTFDAEDQARWWCRCAGVRPRRRLARHCPGVRAIGESLLGGEGVGVQPLQELRAPGRHHVGLRVVDVGVDEPGRDELAGQGLDAGVGRRASGRQRPPGTPRSRRHGHSSITRRPSS